MPQNKIQPPNEKVVLSVAGTDPLAGAGCAADLATFHAFGWAGACVETAWVVQNSLGVHGFTPSDVHCFRKRVDAVLEDCHIAAIKIGMMASEPLIHALAEALAAWGHTPPVVLDPVGAAGGRDAQSLYRGEFDRAFDALFPYVHVITPNQRELHALTGIEAHTHAEAQTGAEALHARGVHAVLLKGGHLEPRGTDRLSVAGDTTYDIFEGAPWGVDIHGTGCHLSSAIACGLAQGQSVVESSRAASRWLHTLVQRRAYHGLGRGRPQFDARRLHLGFSP